MEELGRWIVVRSIEEAAGVRKSLLRISWWTGQKDTVVTFACNKDGAPLWFGNLEKAQKRADEMNKKGVKPDGV